MICLTGLVATGCSSGDSETTAAANTVVFSDGWVALPPPEAERTAGYVTVTNGYDQAIKIVRAYTQAFGRVEMHTMAQADGTMQMRPVDGFTVEAGQTVKLAPGGDHLMLIYPRDPLSAGQNIEFSLALRDPAGELVKQTAMFEVRAR